MRLSGCGPFGRLLVVTGLLFLAPAVAAAQGSAVYTQSGCMTARNGAGIAAPCQDGSAVYYNPAALAQQNGAASLGVTVIDQSGSFTHDTTAAEIERVPSSLILPHGWAAWRLSDRIGVGIGLFAPYGMAIDWPVCPVDQPRCGTGFEGRFVGYDQTLRGLYLQPTVAYDVIPGRLSLGVGVDLVKGDFEINRRLDLAPQPIEVAPGVSLSFSQLGIAPGTDFADVRVSGDAWGVTGHAGMLLRVTSWISLGARYMHSVELPMEGSADFTQVATALTVGPLGSLFPAGTRLDDFIAESGIFDGEGVVADQDVSATITLPAQAVAGIALQLDPTLRLMFDYQWTQWSAWDTVDVDFEFAPDERLVFDYQDASTLRLAADYVVTDRVLARVGVTHAEAAAGEGGVSPFLPDSDRTFFSGGVHFRASERLSLDVFGMAVNAADRRGRIVERDASLTPVEAEALDSGVYSSDGQLFGVTVTYHFGGPR